MTRGVCACVCVLGGRGGPEFTSLHTKFTKGCWAQFVVDRFDINELNQITDSNNYCRSIKVSYSHSLYCLLACVWVLKQNSNSLMYELLKYR